MKHLFHHILYILSTKLNRLGWSCLCWFYPPENSSFLCLRSPNYLKFFITDRIIETTSLTGHVDTKLYDYTMLLTYGFIHISRHRAHTSIIIIPDTEIVIYANYTLAKTAWDSCRTHVVGSLTSINNLNINKAFEYINWSKFNSSVKVFKAVRNNFLTFWYWGLFYGKAKGSESSPSQQVNAQWRVKGAD